MEDYLVANYDINFRTLWEAPNHSKLLAPPSLSFFVSLSLSLYLPLSLSTYDTYFWCFGTACVS